MMTCITAKEPTYTIVHKPSGVVVDTRVPEPAARAYCARFNRLSDVSGQRAEMVPEDSTVFYAKPGLNEKGGPA